MKIGDRIKDELSRKGMTQKELCSKVNISESVMSKYLSSERALRSDIVAKIARALDVSIHQLLGTTEEEGDTFNLCKTALLARSGTSLSNDEKKELIDLIFEHD